MDLGLPFVLFVALLAILLLGFWSALSLRDREVDSTRGRKHSRRTGGPASYRTVSIECGPQACGAARTVEGKQFLSHEAPLVPLADCTSANCACKYVHLHDRRKMASDRRSPKGLRAGISLSRSEEADRRSNYGRRRSDWRYA